MSSGGVLLAGVAGSRTDVRTVVVCDEGMPFMVCVIYDNACAIDGYMMFSGSSRAPTSRASATHSRK